MSLPSTYHLHHSLPNRSPSQRPVALSLNGYQPLSFDREAAEQAHQQSLMVPESSTASSVSGHSNYQTDFGGSTDTAATSTLSHNLKPGDNPHATSWSPPPNLAGVGKGHSLSPPGSPVHSSAARQNQAMLSPVPQSPVPAPSSSNQYFDANSQAQYSQQTVSTPYSGEDYERGFSAMSVNDDNGYTTDPGGHGLRGGGGSRSRRRSLPSVPSDIPTPVSENDMACVHGI